MRTLIVLLVFISSSFLSGQTIPITGPAVPQLSQLDTTMQSLMTTYSVPGATLAVMHGGKLVFARGYGYANTTTLTQVQPDSLFRIASITKPHTAAAILRLIEMGKLSMTDKAFTILSKFQPLPGATEDPRVAQITVQNLLEHKSGWYGEADGTGYDPLFDVVHIAQVAGVTAPADDATIVRYMLGRPLDTDPGSYYSYSNFGYLLLGQIVQQVSGQSYESFVIQNVLRPVGNSRSQFGSTLTALPGEVSYYPYPQEPLTTSIFPGGGPVTFPNGGYSVEDNHANGGMVSNTLELLQFLGSVNGSRTPALFQTPVSGFPGYIAPYGKGWTWIFHGSLPGNNSSLTLLPDQTGICWLTNSRPADYVNSATDFDNQLQAIVKAVTSWPTTDLTASYTTGFQVLQSASYVAQGVAPDQFVTLYGTNLAGDTKLADVAPLPTSLAGITITVTDSTGKSAAAPLDYVSPTQVNMIIPSGLAAGPATVTISGASTVSTTVQIANVAPGIFTANSSGTGVPAAFAGLYTTSGSNTPQAVFTCPASYQCVPAPMSVGGPTDQLILELYGTGIRHASAAANVVATVNGQTVPVAFAGAQGQYEGLDQVNIVIPYSFKGAGTVPVVITVDGNAANTVMVQVQ